MDKFVTKIKKIKTPFDSIPGAVCVWGPHGCGKTTWVKKNFEYIEINYDNPAEFMERIGSKRWVLIDNYEELDHSLYESFYDRPYTLIISKYEIPEIHCYEFANKNILVPRFGKMDIFKDPKDIIIDSIQNYSTSYLHLLDSCEGEHGNNIGIIEENLTHSSLTLDEIFNVLDLIAHASEIDELMYKGNWSLFQIFNFFGYVYPCSIIKGRINTADSASMWTKFLNMKMREKKLKELKMDADEIQIAREYAISGVNKLNLCKQDIDALKYGDFYGKLKNKHIQKLKKCQ